MSNRAKTFKLLVKTSDNCIELLKYINKNIATVNKLGVKIRVDKLKNGEFDEDMVNMLKNKGITRLPALITSDGSVFIGLKSIIDLFEKNLNAARGRERVEPVAHVDVVAEMGTNPDMNAWWMRELYAGVDKSGKAVPRKDKDEDEDNVDYDRLMREQNRRGPKHRQPDTEETDIEMPTRRTRDRPRPRDDEPDDNIADPDEEVPKPARRQTQVPISRSDDVRGDSLDSKMLAAWMENNPSDN